MPTTGNRRRAKRPSSATGQDGVSIATGSSDTNHRRQRNENQNRTVGLCVKRLVLGSRRDIGSLRNLRFLLMGTPLAILVYHFLLRNSGFRASSSSNEPILVGASPDFQAKYYQSREIVKQNKDLYDSVYKLASERLLPPDQTNWPDYESRPYKLESTYGSSVETCDITIVLTDPRLGSPKYEFGPGQPMWFALESIGAFSPESCVVLQTSTCAMQDYLGDTVAEEDIQAEVGSVIYDNSLPLFRRMIEAGLVRITFLDYQKYNLKSCRDYGNPTPAFTNRWFWQDEFIDGVDSDLVTVFQDDAALCYPLDVEGLTEYAFIGGLWPKKPTRFTPDPMEGACLGMSGRWRTWLHPQRRWKMQQSNPKLAAKARVTKPKELLNEEFPPVCEDGQAPVGNGGFSLRSRQWMIRAIETCPHTSNSGMDLDDEPLACKVFETINEDFYFGTILRGMGAPLPTAYTASLFSTEMLWPEQSWELYGLPNKLTSDLRGSVVTGKPFVQMGGKRLTIPNGVHKPWWYHPNEITRSSTLTDGCPFLQYIFTPDMTRWEEVNQELPHWVGVGT